MAPPKHAVPPMADYTIKMMLLEALSCYHNGNSFGLRWLEQQMFIFHARLRELEKRG